MLYMDSIGCIGDGDKPESLLRVEKLTGKRLKFYQLSLGDSNALDKVFQL